MSEIGRVAGVDGLYWRGGLWAFDADTSSRLLIEEDMTGHWQGVIRVRAQDGQAATLLQKAIKLIERSQAQFSMRPTAVERPVAVELHGRAAIVAGHPSRRSEMPEWYVSYAWGDDRTPEGRARKQVVDDLCAAARADGHHILRDTDVLSLGDSISAFMKRIGSGDRVFVILSDKYLRSPFCMFELSEIWRTSKQEGPLFLERVRIYSLPDANIFKPTDWIGWAAHWKQEHDALDADARRLGTTLLGTIGFRRLTQMQTFYTQVSDILGTLADIVQPRTLDELKRYGFDDPPTPGS